MIFRRPYPDVSIPELPLTPYLLQHAGHLTNKPALIDGATGSTYSYGQLAAAVRHLGANLARRGLTPGSVFAFYSPNSPEYVIALLAMWSIGGVATTVNPLAPADELARQLTDAGACMLLTAPELMSKALSATRDLGMRQLITVGGAEGATPLAQLLEDGGEAEAVHVDPLDLAALPYSSGTTGFPKGVMLTHRNLVANMCQLQPLLRLSAEDVGINAMPFFHAAGWVILFHMGLANGCTVVTLPRFELEPFLRASQDYGVTSTLLVPPVVLALAKQPAVEHYTLSRFKVIFAGAAPLGEEVARTCAARIGCRIQQIYGVTETSPATHANPAESAFTKIASVGVCIPNTECRVIDLASGGDVAPNQHGELWVRGPQ
jgi:acyl-CoA synthetase (AMP-forming)/AMP-acid ligase II